MATKKATKATKSAASQKYSFVNSLYEQIGSVAQVTRTGEVKIKRTDLKKLIEETFQKGVVRAAGGERVRFPVIGAIIRRDIKERKSGKGVNPFTGEPMTIKARPASKKPRWSFPKSLKEVFANKKYW